LHSTAVSARFTLLCLSRPRSPHAPRHSRDDNRSGSLGLRHTGGREPGGPFLRRNQRLGLRGGGGGCAGAPRRSSPVPFRSPRASLSAAAGRAVAAMLLRAAGCWRAAASRPGPVWLRGAEHRGLPLASRRLGLPLPLPLAAGGRRLRSGCGALPEVRWEGKGLGLAALCFARNTNVTGRLGRHIWFLVFAWHEVCYGMVVSDWGSER